MIEGPINLISDTQTRPTTAMLEAMMAANVGDEQKGLDPTVNQLCDRVGDILGKEAAVFLPSGTMCNAISILVHCRPGDEIYAHRGSHIITSEAGGAAALSGTSICSLEGDRGIYSPESLRAAIRYATRYTPKPCMAQIEQTSNFGGGTVWSLQQIHEVSEVANSYNLVLHMDGARLFNATIASGVSAHQFAAPCDTVWIDLSKGLGCPIGGVLAGSAEFIQEAWRWKQRIGGALRQAGHLAAAGLYALNHHIERLEEDHQNARRFGEIVAQCKGIRLDPEPVETNMVFVDTADAGVVASEIRDRLEERGINVGAVTETRLRAVTHLDVSHQQIEEAAQAFVTVVDELRQFIC